MLTLPVLLTLVVIVALPIAWLIAEFGSNRALRITLGMASIVGSMGVLYVVGQLNRFNYNAYYGGTTSMLIDVMVAEIDEGNTDRLREVLRRMQSEYHPTYENRGHYAEIVDAAVEELKGNRESGNEN